MENREKPLLIIISGGTASGKSTLAQIEAIIAGMEIPRVTLLTMDAFYRVRVLSEEEMELVRSGEFNMDHPDALDWPLLEEALHNLLEWKPSLVPVYNFGTHSRESGVEKLKVADVIIFEGVLSLFHPRIAALADLKIFIHEDDDIRLSRRLIRDTRERGRSLGSVLEQYRRYTKPAHHSFIAPAQKVADVVVPGSENERAVGLIVHFITSRLSTQPKQENGRPT